MLPRLLARLGFVPRAALLDLHRLTPAELALLATARASREQFAPEWPRAEREKLDAFLHSETGRRLVAHLHAVAHLELRRAVAAAPGAEARALGHAHGYAGAACLLENLSALIGRDPADHPADDAPSGAPAGEA